jgi:hypothetical protein
MASLLRLSIAESTEAAPSSVFFPLLFLPGSFKSYQQEAMFVKKNPKPKPM